MRYQEKEIKEAFQGLGLDIERDEIKEAIYDVKKLIMIAIVAKSLETIDDTTRKEIESLSSQVEAEAYLEAHKDILRPVTAIEAEELADEIWEGYFASLKK